MACRHAQEVAHTLACIYISTSTQWLNVTRCTDNANMINITLQIYNKDFTSILSELNRKNKTVSNISVQRKINLLMSITYSWELKFTSWVSWQHWACNDIFVVVLFLGQNFVQHTYLIEENPKNSVHIPSFLVLSKIDRASMSLSKPHLNKTLLAAIHKLLPELTIFCQKTIIYTI